MRKLLFVILSCALALPLSAQMRYRVQPQAPYRSGEAWLEEMAGRNRFAWEYDADFRYIFDNREFTPSQDALIPSGTLNTLAFIPTVGFSVQQSQRVHHRLAVGLELAHDMGSQTWAGLATEPVAYYDAHVRTRRGLFEGVAGMFPRRFHEGEYTEAFISGMCRDTDRIVEGLLLKWRGERFFAELGSDWMGKYGHNRRERFQVMSFGRWDATPWLALGWTGAFYHYACSDLASNVIDNHLLEPWIKMDAARRTSWQELSLRLGALVGYQRDRAHFEDLMLPVGGDLILTARRWGIELQNETYVGDNLLPLRGLPNPAGGVYGTDLYFRSPCYDGFYDRVQLAWLPRLNHYLTLRLAVRAHFGLEGFLGWQQQFSLRLSLDALRHRDTLAGRCL